MDIGYFYLSESQRRYMFPESSTLLSLNVDDTSCPFVPISSDESGIVVVSC